MLLNVCVDEVHYNLVWYFLRRGWRSEIDDPRVDAGANDDDNEDNKAGDDVGAKHDHTITDSSTNIL